MGSVIDQEITENYAIYNADCIDIMDGLKKKVCIYPAIPHLLGVCTTTVQAKETFQTVLTIKGFLNTMSMLSREYSISHYRAGSLVFIVWIYLPGIVGLIPLWTFQAI